MKHITSLHLSDNQLRILSLSTTPTTQSAECCCAIDISDKSFPLDVAALEITEAIPTSSGGTLVMTLPGDFFHLQRVPLEVASESDRRAQIDWEASQVLIDPLDNFDIDFVPAGRIAFWTAIRKDITKTYAEHFIDLGFDDVRFITEPFALYALKKSVQTLKSQGAIWLGDKWGSFIAQSTHALTTVETVNLEGKSHKGPQNLSQIRQWIQGDLSAERRRPPFQDILLCGEPNAVEALSETQADFKTPHIIPFEWVKHLPHITNASGVSNANAFALALGAAIGAAQ